MQFTKEPIFKTTQKRDARMWVTFLFLIIKNAFFLLTKDNNESSVEFSTNYFFFRISWKFYKAFIVVFFY